MEKLYQHLQYLNQVNGTKYSAKRDNSPRQWSIYIIKNNIDNKIYIGQTYRVLDRMSQHKYNSVVGTPDCDLPLYKAMRYYESEDFSINILANNIPSQEETDFLEEFYIEKYNCLYPNGYNLTSGGSKAKTHIRFSKKFTTLKNKSIYNDYLSGNFTKVSLAKKYECHRESITKIIKIMGKSAILESQ